MPFHQAGNLVVADCLFRHALYPSLPQIGSPRRSARAKYFPKTNDQPDDVLKIDTDLVSLDVVANELRAGRYEICDRRISNCYLDGVEQPLSFFQVERRSGEPRPLADRICIDISGSMTAEEMERLRSALNAFSARLAGHPALYAVMAFGMNVKMLQKFTSEPDKLDRAFERIAREPNGLSTHTYDAVDDAIRLLVRHAPRTRERRLMKRAVLVVTDGFPVGDTVSPARSSNGPTLPMPAFM